MRVKTTIKICPASFSTFLFAMATTLPLADHNSTNSSTAVPSRSLVSPTTTQILASKPTLIPVTMPGKVIEHLTGAQLMALLAPPAEDYFLRVLRQLKRDLPHESKFFKKCIAIIKAQPGSVSDSDIYACSTELYHLSARTLAYRSDLSNIAAFMEELPSRALHNQIKPCSTTERPPVRSSSELCLQAMFANEFSRESNMERATLPDSLSGSSESSGMGSSLSEEPAAPFFLSADLSAWPLKWTKPQMPLVDDLPILSLSDQKSTP